MSLVLKNSTAMKDKLAPQTTRPAIKNSPINLVLGAKRARSSRKPIVKIPSDPRRTNPITELFTQSSSLNFGTDNPAIKTTDVKDRRIAAPPNLGVAC